MAIASFPRILPKLLPPPPLAAASRPSVSTNRRIAIHAPSPPPLRLLSRRRLPLFRAQENGGASETLEEEEKQEEDTDSGKQEESKEEESTAATAVATELREMMKARKEKEKEGDAFLGGVAEEVREIEWPAFGKVVGTTGVVLAVIAGSTVALLTVNAVLAEISDQVFAGKGIQDFFG
ncbi:uncharacterized protein [Typha angustifolia]|uniref:uncharacterized protein n=1 Tax=Typha angustifolia TaxID=59011 RepID=UPI003C2CA503